MEENYLNELIQKYILGTATADQRDELLRWYRGNHEEELLLPYADANEEEKAKARMLRSLSLQISKHPVKRQTKSFFYQLAAAAVVIIATSVCLYYTFAKKNISHNWLTVITHAGEHKVLRLADGSVIWLSAGSSIKYPTAFIDSTREIVFEGEAFFQIAKDKKHPFIVHTGKTSTRVLGTSFNIIDRKNNPAITVALLTGKVLFSDGKNDVKLIPGRQVVYNTKSGQANLENIPDTAAIANRRNGYYEYNNVKVGDVLQDINLNLNAKVTTSGNVKNCLFYGRFKPGETLPAFLKKLAIIVNARVISQKDGYLIKGRGCD